MRAQIRQSKPKPNCPDPQTLLSTGNSEPRNHTNHAGPHRTNPAPAQSQHLEGGRRGIPEIETLDLAAPSTKWRNPSSARRGPAGASGSAEEDAEATGPERRRRRAPRKAPYRRRQGAEGSSEAAPARARGRNGRRRRARAREGDGEIFRGNF